MSRELRAYRIAEKAMKYSEGKGNYEEYLKKAREYCKKTPYLKTFFSHVGDDYAAKCIAGVKGVY